MSTAPIDPLNSEREFNYIDEDENQNQEGTFSWLSEQSADDLANDFSRRDVHQKEYLQINSRLLDSRKKIKRKMAESTNAFNQAQTDLLQTFERL